MQFNIFYSNSKTFNTPTSLRIEGFTLEFVRRKTFFEYCFIEY